MAKEGVVVKGDLGVQHLHVAVGRRHQRIDLGEAAILVEKDFRQRRDDLLRLRRLFAGEAEVVSQPTGLKRMNPRIGVDGPLEDFLRMLCGHFFDLNAAFRTGHHDGQTNGAVQHDADIDLTGDLRRRVDHQHFRYLLSLIAGLLGDERILEHGLGDLAGFGAHLHELDAAVILAAALERPLAAAAGVDLGLQHDRAAEFVERPHRLGRRRDDDAGRHGGAGVGEELLGLVFVDFHRRVLSVGRCAVGTTFSVIGRRGGYGRESIGGRVGAGIAGRPCRPAPLWCTIPRKARFSRT